ncbi:NUDIX domain-containing protein [Roseibium denhamense]|uniref:GDP-mannose pyrophosphatase n=1 Tax=Roseibium denhamense TaxID=76305 RepID=A0ABY1PN52_9HYPH|nr:NUDIX domain-containing protein [Roseibium denhamense]MTI05758.1 NUDIX domain-containing protein [Roseibium denhamense]SMP36990.1 nudix-type nucleoside diphosphatase, YffH/AdpP family [Roseibium denhamense]
MDDAPNLKILKSEVLSDNWGTLTKYTYELLRRDGAWQEQIREVYDRGHGAACLLYNPQTGCVLLTRQFRLPVFVARRPAHVIEAPAGLLEGENPAARMRAELIEETGFDVSELEHVYDLAMSPGSVSEFLSFFRGTYSLKDQVGEGGGDPHEGEDIEVLHVPLQKALGMIETGCIFDAKTVILLQDLHIRLTAGLLTQPDGA